MTEAWAARWPELFALLVSAVIAIGVIAPTLLMCLARPSSGVSRVERLLAHAPEWLKQVGGRSAVPETLAAEPDQAVRRSAHITWDAHRTALAALFILASLVAIAAVAQFVWTWIALASRGDVTTSFLLSGFAATLAMTVVAGIALLGPIIWWRRAPSGGRYGSTSVGSRQLTPITTRSTLSCVHSR